MIQFKKTDNIDNSLTAPIINVTGNLLAFSLGVSCISVMSHVALKVLGVEGVLSIAPFIVLPVSSLWLGRKIFTAQNIVNCCTR